MRPEGFSTHLPTAGFDVSERLERKPRCPYVLADHYLPLPLSAPSPENLVIDATRSVMVVFSCFNVGWVDEPRCFDVRGILVTTFDQVPVADAPDLRSYPLTDSFAPRKLPSPSRPALPTVLGHASHP